MGLLCPVLTNEGDIIKKIGRFEIEDRFFGLLKV